MTMVLTIVVYAAPAAAQEAPCADLRVSTFEVIPATVFAGVPTTVQVEIVNVGSCATPDFVAQWRQDRFAATGPNELVLGIAAGGSAVVSFPFQFLNPGNFLTVVELDTQNSVLETNEVNNLEIFPVSVLPAIAELVVSDIAVDPEPVIQGLVADISVTVTNAGVVAAGPFLVEVSPGLFLAPLSAEVASLAPGASTVVTVQQSYAFPGDVAITATVDSTFVVPEANEFNNARTESFTVVPAFVDLVITSITTSPDPLVQGRPAQITVTYQNLGNTPAPGPFPVRVKPWFFGPDLTFEVATLGPGEVASHTFDFTFPFAGTFSVDAFVDSEFQVVESNEFNNTSSLTVVVEPPLPDLEITNVEIVPPEPVAGLTARADITVTNTGNDPSGPAIVTWRTWFFGPDHSIEVPGLAVGASATVSLEHTYGFPGLFDTTVTVDSTFAVAEVDEFNNTQAVQVEVQAPFVDLVLVDLEVLPPALDADAPATGRITIRNDGNFPANEFVVRWKPSPFAPDRNQVVDGLAPGETKVIDLVHTYGSAGVLVTTTATVDATGVIAESNETNNTVTKQVNVAPVGPDLVITSIEQLQREGPAVAAAFGSATQGIPITVRVTVLNQGNRPAGPFELEWNPGVPFELITQGPATLSTQIPGLGAGATTFFDFEYVYPASGNFRSVANVDAFGDVAELNEANNLAILNMEVAPGIDLAVTNFQVVAAVGDEVVAQSEAVAQITVQNNGFFPARGFQVSWNPTDNAASIFNPSVVVAELAPGASTVVSISSSYFFPGTFTSGVFVDSLNTVIEFNEDNNKATTSVTVVPRSAVLRIRLDAVDIDEDFDDGLFDGDAEIVVVAAGLNPGGGDCTAFDDFVDVLGGIFDDIFGFLADLFGDGFDPAVIPETACSFDIYNRDTPARISLGQTFDVTLTDPVPLILFGAIGEEDEPLTGDVLGAFADLVPFNDLLTGPTRTIQPLEVEGLPTDEFSDLTYTVQVIDGPPPIFDPA